MTALSRLRASAGSGPLASRPFRLLAAGQFTSTVGDYCYAVALPWLVLSAHGGTVLLGEVLACYGVPRTVLIPLGGMLADKAGPRAVMLAVDAARCALVAVLAFLAARHLVLLAALGPVAALLGSGEGLFLPASMAIMPTLLDSGRLQAGNALNFAAVELGSFVGPAVGGVLVAGTGPATGMAVDAASFAVSAAALALMPGRRAGPAPPAMAGAGSGSGHRPGAEAPQAERGRGVLRLLRRARLLQVIVVVCVVANVAFGGTFEVALPALAHARFGAAGYGALLACLGAGAVIGTLAAARAGGLSRPAVVACGAFLLQALMIGLVPFLGGLPGAAAAVLVFGACNGFGNTVFLTLLQQWAPPRLLGRVMSLVMLAAMGSFPVSAAVSGVAVRSLGPVPFFPAAAIILALTMLGALTQREIRSFGAAGAVRPGLSADSSAG